MGIRPPVALLASTALAVTGLGVVVAPASAATTYSYPSPACPVVADHGLQDCIDNAAAGDTIVLTSQVNPDAGALIDKSLTLRATDRSLHPQLPSIGVYDHGDTSTANHITLQDLIVGYGIFGNFDQAAGHSLTIRRVQVGKAPGNVSGIVISATGHMDLTVEQSYIRTTDHQRGSLEFYATHATGTSHVRIVGNTLTQHGSSDSGSGIDVTLDGNGTSKVDIDNNKIWDVVGDDAGGASGIFVYPDQQAKAVISVVGNTLDRVGSHGISLRNDVVAPGHLTFNVFDNLVSHARGAGIQVSSTTRSTLTFHAGYNDSFANDDANFLEGRSGGPGNLHKDPRYVKRSTGDLRLSASSPLIDQGSTCTSGGLSNLDAAGNGRLAGRSVDMGAYEHGAGAATGVVRLGTGAADTLTGTSGRDILCGYGGKDVLNGLAGADYLDGGSSDDKLTGGSGADRLLGGSGKDKLCARDGVHGNDVLNGGSSTDSGDRDSGDAATSVEHATSC